MSKPAFEQGEGDRAEGWNVWLQDSVGSLKRSEDAAQAGRYGMIGEGIQYGGPHQSVDFAPGRYCLVASLFVPPGQPDGGFVDISLRALDKGNRNLPNGGTSSITPTPGIRHTIRAYPGRPRPPQSAGR